MRRWESIRTPPWESRDTQDEGHKTISRRVATFARGYDLPGARPRSLAVDFGGLPAKFLYVGVDQAAPDADCRAAGWSFRSIGVGCRAVVLVAYRVGRVSRRVGADAARVGAVRGAVGWVPGRLVGGESPAVGAEVRWYRRRWFCGRWRGANPRRGGRRGRPGCAETPAGLRGCRPGCLERRRRMVVASAGVSGVSAAPSGRPHGVWGDTRGAARSANGPDCGSAAMARRSAPSGKRCPRAARQASVPGESFIRRAGAPIRRASARTAQRVGGIARLSAVSGLPAPRGTLSITASVGMAAKPSNPAHTRSSAA